MGGKHGEFWGSYAWGQGRCNANSLTHPPTRVFPLFIAHSSLLIAVFVTLLALKVTGGSGLVEHLVSPPRIKRLRFLDEIAPSAPAAFDYAPYTSASSSSSYVMNNSSIGASNYDNNCTDSRRTQQIVEMDGRPASASESATKDLSAAVNWLASTLRFVCCRVVGSSSLPPSCGDGERAIIDGNTLSFSPKPQSLTLTVGSGFTVCEHSLQSLFHAIAQLESVDMMHETYVTVTADPNEVSLGGEASLANSDGDKHTSTYSSSARVPTGGVDGCVLRAGNVTQLIRQIFGPTVVVSTELMTLLTLSLGTIS